MAIIKYVPDDFKVNEIINIDLVKEGSNNHIYLMKKRNYTTERAVSQIAKSLHLPRKFVGYAGTKDKQAITTQYISIAGVSKEKVERLQLKDIEVQFVGYSKNPVTLGDLKGNSFEIVLRNLSKDFKLNAPNEIHIPNYFDEQRFSNANLAIGLSMINNDFKKTADLLIETDKDFGELVKQHLEKKPNDFIGAIKKLPKKTILFFVHSVQSYFYNEILAQEIKKTTSTFHTIKYSEGEFVFPNIDSKLAIEQIPLIGYLSQGYDEYLKKFNLIARNFLIRSLPDFSLEGGFRNAFFKVENFEISKLETDEEFPENKKCTIKFDLESGSYATIVLKAILAQKDIELQETERKPKPLILSD